MSATRGIDREGRPHVTGGQFRPWGAALLGAFAIVLGLSAASPVAAEAPRAVTHVREFLESPPRYESLLLRRVLAVAPVGFRSEREATRFVERVRSGAVVPRGETNHFEIRFQSDPPAFLLRALVDASDFEGSPTVRPSPLAGRYGSNWWAILDGPVGQIQLLRSLDGLDAPEGGPTNAYHAGNERWATEFFRLGLLEVLPASLRWQPGGHAFTARTESGTLCEGEVRPGDVEGESLILLKPDPSGVGRRIRVAWQPGTIPAVPRRVEVDHWAAALGPASTRRYATYEALEHRLASGPLPREHFSPEPFLRTNDLWVEVESGRHYVLRAQGTNVIRELAPQVKRGWDLRATVRAAFVAVIAVAAVLLAAAYVSEWRSRRRASSFLAENP